MKTFRSLILGISLMSIVIASACTSTATEEPDDEFGEDEATNQLVEAKAEEALDSDIPSPELVAQESAIEAVDSESPSTIVSLPSEQQALAAAQDTSTIEPYQAPEAPVEAVKPVEISTADSLTDPTPLAEMVPEAIAPTSTIENSEQVLQFAEVKKSKNGKKKIGNRKAETASATDPSGAIYVVQPGDTLGKISAIIYGRSGRWQELASLNNLSGRSVIYPGDQIKYATNDESAQFAAKYSGLSRSKVVVENNDTLQDIAERKLGNRAYWRLIWHWNRTKIGNPNRIFTGQTLEYIASEQLSALMKDRKSLRPAH